MAYDVVHLALTRFDKFQLGKAFGNVDLSTLEGRLGLLVTVLFYLGVYTLAVVILVGLTRYRQPLRSVFTDNVSTINNTHEHALIKTGNQILRNTIEQSTVFFAFYIYWLHLQTGNHDSIQTTPSCATPFCSRCCSSWRGWPSQSGT